jgi:hypothetical protein
MYLSGFFERLNASINKRSAHEHQSSEQTKLKVNKRTDWQTAEQTQAKLHQAKTIYVTWA